MILRLLAKIPDQAPAAFVLAMFFCIAAAILMGAAIVFSQVGWRGFYLVAFAMLVLCILDFICCIVWFQLEQASGRFTRWRR